MANIVTSKTDKDKKDLDTAQKLKPALRNFVTKMQYDNAEKVAKENKIKAEEKLSDESIKLQCSRLAMRAILDLRLWVKWPSPLDMAWTVGRTRDGRALTVEEMETERNMDIAGFSSYLLDEYYNNKKEVRTGTYLHPLLEKNLEFFWQKFVKDLVVTIEIDRRRQSLGNQGIILIDD